MYAKVYPISSDGHQNGRAFTAYLQPIQAQGNYQPVYQTLCIQEPGNGNYGVYGKVNQWNGNQKPIIDDYNRLINAQPDASQSINQRQTPADKSKKPSGVQINAGLKPMIPQKKIEIPKKQKGGNVNSANNVMQCEGVTCPKDTTECKVSEKSDEPMHETITTKIFCMDANQRILKEEKKTLPNPQKGNSISNTRSINGNLNNEFFTQLQDEMDETMSNAKNLQSQSIDDMQKQMSNIFNNGFFANNPFIK